jgi:hypothetical protein
MDNHELLQEMTKRIDTSATETRAYVDSKVAGATASTGARIEEAVRELRVVVEAAHHPIRMIADGHMMLVEALDRVAGKLRCEMRKQGDLLRTEMRAGDSALREEIRAGDAALREELVSFRAEVRGEFAEVRRVARVESAVSDLSTRVGRLEKRTGA